MNHTGIEHHDFVLAHAITRSRRTGKERANHKYIKREWNNGRWTYTYKDDTNSRGNNRDAPKKTDFSTRSPFWSLSKLAVDNGISADSAITVATNHKKNVSSQAQYVKDHGKNVDYYVKNISSPGSRAVEYSDRAVTVYDPAYEIQAMEYIEAYTTMDYDFIDEEVKLHKAKKAVDAFIQKMEHSKKNVVKSKGTTSTSARASSKLTTISQK